MSKRPPGTGIMARAHTALAAKNGQQLPSALPTPSPPSPPTVAHLVSRSLDQIEKLNVDWLWRGRIPFGMFTVFDGDPALGKSLIALDIAGRYSLGKSMPCCENVHTEPGNSLIIAAEDAAETTIKPRCIVAGCDEKRIRVSETIRIGKDERPIRFPDDFDLLEREMREQSIGFLVIDPLLGFLSHSIDSHKDQSIRDVLHRLKIIAGKTGAAILGIRHLNKSGIGKALYRGQGSIGITAAARSALTVGPDPHEEGARVFASTKCNLVQTPRSIKYGVIDAHGYPVISWGVECEISADELGIKICTGKNSARDDAIDFLREVLSKGPRLASEVEKLAENAGISKRTLDRAKKALPFHAFKTGFSNNTWYWKLMEGAGGECQLPEYSGTVGKLHECSTGG